MEKTKQNNHIFNSCSNFKSNREIVWHQKNGETGPASKTELFSKYIEDFCKFRTTTDLQKYKEI